MSNKRNIRYLPADKGSAVTKENVQDLMQDVAEMVEALQKKGLSYIEAMMLLHASLVLFYQIYKTVDPKHCEAMLNTLVNREIYDQTNPFLSLAGNREEFMENIVAYVQSRKESSGSQTVLTPDFDKSDTSIN